MVKPLYEIGDKITKSGVQLECTAVSATQNDGDKMSNFAYEFRPVKDMEEMRKKNRAAALEAAETEREETAARVNAEMAEEAKAKQERADRELQEAEHKRLDHKHDSIPEPTDDDEPITPQPAKKGE